MVRIPVHVGEKLKKIERAHLELTEKLGREPKAGELAEKSGISIRKLDEILRIVEGR